MSSTRALAASALAAALCPGASAQDWTHHARGPERVAAIDLALAGAIGSPTWVRSTTAQGAAIEFVGQASLVAAADVIVATGWIGNDFFAIAIESADGNVRWMAPMPQPVADSWSAPAIDTSRATAIVASGRAIKALSLADGATVWEIGTMSDIVNAAPLIVENAGSAARAFMTDFGFGAQPGRLYAINLDAFDAISNPFAPGDLVWSRAIGPLSGATPALHEHRVLIATSDGRVLAFDATAVADHAPLFEAINPTGLGFFGGISVRDGFAYAASYAFFGGLSSANMIKIDAATGTVIWSVPSNRTDATPVPLADGRILLSAGIAGFGSQPSLSLYVDHGASVSRAWDTHLAGGPAAGFWTFTPVALETMNQALAPAPPAANDPLGPMPRTLRLDLAKHPTDAGFVVETIEGAAISAATASGQFFGVGAGGVAAFAAALVNCPGDFNGNGTIDIFDAIAFLAAFSARDPAADLNGDGLFDFFDVQLFLAQYAAGCS
ncbi:MAG: PQQ-binding-like beta-propeller repeat protein [Phycisphaeraceae bacterium]|nr:PQQ-binding-like beta-propeller repeat protein [Phycisphaeraceae bacterium]MCW5762717.1 PQQ-binding-like beta-propeller repeat protein [Phycisphaeraceae bacterium]